LGERRGRDRVSRQKWMYLYADSGDEAQGPSWNGIFRQHVAVSLARHNEPCRIEWNAQELP
jgi:hypothetical protein